MTTVPQAEKGAPESKWYSLGWQITTWLSREQGWCVRVDGPDEMFWEEHDLKNRHSAHIRGTYIAEGFQT